MVYKPKSASTPEQWNKHLDRVREYQRRRYRAGLIPQKRKSDYTPEEWKNKMSHHREYCGQWRVENRDRDIETHKIWAERNPERAKAIKRNWNARHKEQQAIKIWCRNQVNNAINDHHLVRPTQCSICPFEGRIDAHHEDYSKPFEIVWLCRKCHYALHREKKKAA